MDNKILGVLVIVILGVIVYTTIIKNSGELEETIVDKPENEINIIDNQIKEEINMSEKNENKIITTASGLQYQVLVMGDGQKPDLTNTVEVHYHGTLEDGTVFDSSVERNEKISFPLNGVIIGWQEGLQLMPVGSKFKFIIPAELAYGPEGAGHSLSGKTLIFEVELFSIK